MFDIVRGYHWPAPYTGRSLNNAFMARWQGREDELARALPAAADAFFAAQRAEDFDTAMVWAGEAVDLIHDVSPAAQIVARISGRDGQPPASTQEVIRYITGDAAQKDRQALAIRLKRDLTPEGFNMVRQALWQQTIEPVEGMAAASPGVPPCS